MAAKTPGPNCGTAVPNNLPAIDEEFDVCDLYQTYRDSCRIRLEACGDDPGLLLGTLQPLVNELLDQNQVLIQSISQLRGDRSQEKPILCTRCSSPLDPEQETDRKPVQQVNDHPDPTHINASDVIRELNSHLTSLQIENNRLRDKNDNLEHDIENLLDMIEFERNCHSLKDGIQDPDSCVTTVSKEANNKTHATNYKLLTFCDSLQPEDVYGPIESLNNESTSERLNQQQSDENSDRCTIAKQQEEGEEVEEVDCEKEEEEGEREGPASGQKANVSLKSLDGNSIGRESGISSGCESLSTTGSSVTTSRRQLPAGPAATTTASAPISSPAAPSVSASPSGESCVENNRKLTVSTSSTSLASSNLQLLVEEKELLIEDLQQHLESLTRQVQLSDEVIKKIEAKLTLKRKECNEWRSRAFDYQRRLNDHIKENVDLKERILILNDHKRCLMTRLDEESDECQKAVEELMLMRRRSAQLQQQNEFQSMTIEHLKEAMIAKARSSSSRIATTSSSSTPSLNQRFIRNSRDLESGITGPTMQL